MHGLTGDRDRTWTHPSSSEPWPKNLLPVNVPKARLLTFGYNAYIAKRGAAVLSQLVDHSKDFLNALTSLRHVTATSTQPLIFVAHSLGGLVCKDAILESKNNPDPHLQDVSKGCSLTVIQLLKASQNLLLDFNDQYWKDGLCSFVISSSRQALCPSLNVRHSIFSTAIRQ